MKNWRLFAAALAVALCLIGAAITQPLERQGPRRGPAGPRPDGPRRPDPVKQAIDDLKLSEKQQTQAEEILKEYHDKMRQASERNREDLLKQMTRILSAEQTRQLKDALDRLPPPPPPPPPPPGPEDAGPGRAGRPVPIGDFIDRVMAFDKNKDGKVTREELPERMQDLIERGDTNKDGALDREELKALAEKMDQDRPPRGPGGPPPGRGPNGPGAPERALDQLKLTEAQQTRADEILRANRDEVRKLLDQNRDKLLRQMKDVLDRDQLRQFERALEEQRPGGPGEGRRPPRPRE